MNKKFLSAILFGALMVTSTGTFVSCKDYDDDIENLQSQIDKKASIEELNAKVASVESSLGAALSTAQATAEAAKKAAEEAKAAGNEALAAAKDAEAKAAEAKTAAIKAAQDEVAALKAELMEALDASKEEMKKLAEDVEALVNETVALIGHRLSSIALIPTQHINGIAAITVNTLMYTPQTYVALKEHAADPSNHQGRPVLDHIGVEGAVARYISSNNNVAKFHLNPSLGVRPQDILLPSFDCITSTNLTRSAEEELVAGLNNPIMAVPLAEGEELDIKDGILTLKIQKSKEALNEFIGTKGYAHGQGGMEEFYMASLKVPVAEANWTDAEKEAFEKGEITGVYVNSEYNRIEEIVRIPYLVNSKTDFSKTITADFADEIQNDGTADFYVHYHDSVCLYESANNKLVDVKVAYNKPLDLKELVKVCAIDAEVENGDETADASSHSQHIDLKDYASYGLAFRFELAKEKYFQGVRETDEQEFAKINNSVDGIMTSKVYSVGGNGDSRAAIGREPIVRVSLIDTNNDNALVAQRYIKVRWTDAQVEDQEIPGHDFSKQYVTCKAMFQQLLTKEMNEKIYHMVKMTTDGSTTTNSISKENFHKIYKNIEILSLMKDGVDLLKDEELALVVSTNPADFNEGATKQVTEGDETMNGDVVFAFLPEEEADETNMSWNLVWSMSPKAVGTLKDLKASEFEITVKYVDPDGVHGAVKQTFKQVIEIPTQEFAYQATYWKDGIGEGVFNVNPIVYNTNNDGTVGTAAHSEECKLTDYSHIEADLVNGYIYKATNKKPANLDEYIQYIRGCADVKFIFDAERFADYEHLEGYTVNNASTVLYKGTPFALDWVLGEGQNENNITVGENKTPAYIQKEGVAASITTLMGADKAINTDKKDYAWEYNETLGNDKNECMSIIRLHELDDLNATDAAKALVGKKVPVNLIVKYNEYNVVTEQKFEVFFINPLEIDGDVNDSFTDAVINGDFLSVAENFTFTDWNKYTVAKAVAADATEKGKYAHDLYDYYAVKNVVFATDDVKTSLTLVGNSYEHKEGVTDGELPAKASLKQMNWDETKAKSTAEVVEANPSHLAYFNYEGTPVNVNYQLFVDVKVEYKWGTLGKAGLPIWVMAAEGTDDVNQGTTGDNTGSDNENNG